VHYTWFDVVYLVYLPVGHTHKKVDRDLFAPIGNRKKTDNCPTMDKFPNFITSCFKKDVQNRPSTSSKVYTWNWKQWLEPNQRDISQFVDFRAFKFCKNPLGMSVMFYKASILDNSWRGYQESLTEGPFNLFNNLFY
jgi:hypothetical protein